MTEQNKPGDTHQAINSLDIGKLNAAGGVPSASLVPLVLTLRPGDLTRQHLGRKVRFQQISEDGRANVFGVIEGFHLMLDGYELTLDSGSILRGNYADGATVQFL